MVPTESSTRNKAPEEAVRQRVIEALVEAGFPRHLMAVEQKVGTLSRRLDLLCYGNFGSEVLPLLLVECKAVPLTKATERQVAGYNYHIRAPFIAIVNGEEMRWGRCGDPLVSGMPTYEELWRRFSAM